MKARVNIGGDFCITPEYIQEQLFTDQLLKVFHDSDLNIMNLECPVMGKLKGEKIIKTGPHLYTTYDVFDQLKRLNVHAVTLANNHIMDFGEEGIVSTVEGCKQANILFTGAGRNVAEASVPLIQEVKGLRIAIVNFCENEWSVATTSSWGANPMNIIDNVQQIKTIRKQADFVLVVIHGGHEIYNLPSPRMVKEYRFFIENGADAIIGHHPHYISGYEFYRNKPIFYSLGNFIFTMKTPYKGWYKGLVAQLEISKHKVEKFKLIPVIQENNSFQLSAPEGAVREEILAEVEKYTSIIGNDKKLKQNWEEFVLKKKRNVELLSPLNVLPGKYLRSGLTRLGMNHILMRRNYLSEILNHIRCESHRDVMISLLQKKISKRNEAQ
jgi:poly-gamma-glutamate capsule biosynthesis protein CapA/YwtB (metallophosphatase superfamily)